MDWDTIKAAVQKQEHKGDQRHHDPFEKIAHGMEVGHNVLDKGHTVLEWANKLGVGGPALREGLKHGGAFLSPAGMLMGGANIYKGARQGGAEGADSIIKGTEGVVDGIAGLPGITGTPASLVLKALSGGMKVGHALDNALGISDAISERTSGRKALMDQHGMHFIKPEHRGAQHLDKVGTSWQELIHNEMYKLRMRAQGLEFDPAVGNWVPKHNAAPAPAAQAEPFQHFAQ